MGFVVTEMFYNSRGDLVHRQHKRIKKKKPALTYLYQTARRHELRRGSTNQTVYVVLSDGNNQMVRSTEIRPTA